MSIFESVTRELLNEISADDAYAKFYSKIPRDEFDKIVETNKGKFDNFVKILLNGLLNGEFEDYSEVIYAINVYRGLENKLKIFISNKIKNKEYSKASDLFDDLLMADSGEFQITSTKELYNNGLVTIAEDSTILATCTTNYAASHHFYGDSQWCTASDRFGKYDGFEYYSQYITDTMSDWDDDEWMDEKVKVKMVLVQFVDKSDRKKSIQAAMSPSIKDCVDCCCDFADLEISIDDFLNKIEYGHRDLFNEVVKQLPQLIKLTQEQRNVELKYELSRQEYVNRRREIEEKRRLEKFDRDSEKCNELNKEFEKEVAKSFMEILSTKKYLNPEFLNSLHTWNDVYKIYDEFDTNLVLQNDVDINKLEQEISFLKEHNFLIRNNIKFISPLENSKIGVLELECINGMKYIPVYAGEIYKNVSFDKFIYEARYCYITLLVECDSNGNVLSVVKTLRTWPSDMGFYTFKERFNITGGIYNNFYVLVDAHGVEIHSYKNDDFIKIENTPLSFVFKTENGIVTSSMRYVCIIDLINMEYKKSKLIACFGDGYDRVVLADEDRNIYYTNSKREASEIKIKKLPNPDNVIWIDYLNGEVLAVYFKETPYATLYKLHDLEKVIAECEVIQDISKYGDIIYKPVANNKVSVSYCALTNRYSVVDAKTGQWRYCDKDGNPLH